MTKSDKKSEKENLSEIKQETHNNNKVEEKKEETIEDKL